MSSSSEPRVAPFVPLAGERRASPQVTRAEDLEALGTVSLLAPPELPQQGVEAEINSLARTLLGEIVNQARQDAQAQGYAVGWAQGRREAAAEAAAAAAEAEAALRAAEEQRRHEHAEALAALAQAAAGVRVVLEELTAEIEVQGTELAWALTEQIMTREVAVATGADVVRRVLQVLPGTHAAVVRMHPDHVDDDTVAKLREHGLQIVADSALGRADAIVEADGAVTDLRVDAAMARVREVLR